MIIKTHESYVLSDLNIEEIIESLNIFCENGFNHTHDWLEFPDKPSKSLDELTYEKLYPSYIYRNGTK